MYYLYFENIFWNLFCSYFDHDFSNEILRIEGLAPTGLSDRSGDYFCRRKYRIDLAAVTHLHLQEKTLFDKGLAGRGLPPRQAARSFHHTCL